MHLLNVHSLQLSEFTGEVGASIPEYAILSHTWGDEEVSYADYKLGAAHCPRKRGYDKILGACRWAGGEGFDYVWIDTCCIDKDSSAQLSEAINSMFNWYRCAAVCGAYLADVDGAVESTASNSPFFRSKWWTRGWTLQEFLAPGVVVFLASDWTEIGTRLSLERIASTIIGIDPFLMHNLRWRTRCNAAQKMSWVRSRTTTRAEDIAYCLMGLFDVNMPLLCGEGHKAFMRLQLEIWRQTADESLLAWSMASSENRHIWTEFFLPWTGLFAPSPLFFGSATGVVAFDYPEDERHESRFEIVNEAIRIQVTLLDSVQTIWFNSQSDHFAQMTGTRSARGQQALHSKPNHGDFRRVNETPVVIVPLRCRLNWVSLGILLG
jgi:hypothetical protein